MLPKTKAYIKSCVQTKWMYLLIENDDLFEKCNNIWNKVSADIKRELDNEPVYIKSFKEIPKASFGCTCLAVITIDPGLKKDKNSNLKKKHYVGYYTQIQVAMGIAGLKWCHFANYVE